MLWKLRSVVAPVTLGLALLASQANADEKKSLGVGDKAPALDIEHWFAKGDAAPAKVSQFESGKVYVVEFWATWCGPCIASMPHLAEVQNKYRDTGLRIVSVSDEDLETVEKFLEREVPNRPESEESMTFAQLTSAYSLTTDPDTSVYQDYMVAAGQNGIPTAFIVGKQGIVEWIGHPMTMDEPLEQVLTDSWDREAFIEEQRKQREFEMKFAEARRMFNEGEAEKAFSTISAMLSETDDPVMVLNITSILASLKEEQAKDAAVVDEAIAKLQQMSKREGTPDQIKPYFSFFQARLQMLQGKLEDAIASQQVAVKLAGGSQLEKPMSGFLAELKAKAEGKEEGDDEK